MRRSILPVLLLFFTNPLSAQTDERIELTEERDMFSRTYLKENGRKEKVIYAGPVNYLKHGEWHPVETTLKVSRSEQWSYVNESNSIVSRFPNEISAGTEIELEISGQVVRIVSRKQQVIADEQGNVTTVLTTPQPSAPQAEENRIYFSNVYDGFSDSYEILEGMLKNNVILDQMPVSLSGISEGYYGFRESIVLPEGWELRAILGGSSPLHKSPLEIVDENGDQVLFIPSPIFYDLPSMHGDGSCPGEGAFMIDHVGNEWYLSTLVPVDWMKAPERVYPLTIDPTVTIPGTTGGWQSQNNYVDNNGFVFIGVCCGNLEHRAWVKWNISSIPDNSCIMDVQMQIYVNGVGASTAELVHANDITGQFGPYGSINSAAYQDIGNGYYTSFTLTGTGYYGYYDLGPNADALLQNQLTGNWYQVGMIFDYEPSTNWKRLTGTSCNLRVEYQDPPCVVLPVELVAFETKCINNRAELSWTTVSEQNNDYFTIWSSKDGENFEEAGIVDGIGNSQQVHNYSWTSNVREDELTYYRISQTDLNGATEFFDVKVFEGCDRILPHVFVSNGAIIVEGEAINGIRVTDQLGRVVMTRNNAAAEERIELGGLTAQGMLLVTVVHHNGEIFTERVVR